MNETSWIKQYSTIRNVASNGTVYCILYMFGAVSVCGTTSVAGVNYRSHVSNMDADSAELLETDESVDNDNRSTVKKRPYGRYLRNWRYLVVAGAPVVFSPLLFLVDTKAS